MSESTGLKRLVRAYWERQSCDTHIADAPKYSKDYFDQIETFRYRDQPFIHAFAQFSRYHGRRVLEIGVGAGTDFVQWLRAGARASGIDLTWEAVAHVTHRVDVYELPRPETLQVADAEHLPFRSETFDLVYSFGVLHHSPDTMQAVREAVRVTRRGGEIKIMLYNRHSVWVANNWIKYALLRGRPWRSIRAVIWDNMESVGTKAYTRTELRGMFAPLPLRAIQVRTEMTSADYLAASALKPLNLLGHGALRLAGQSEDWRVGDYGVPAHDSRERFAFSGNPLGFFHCISAVKE